jgi:hypothetical protein
MSFSIFFKRYILAVALTFVTGCSSGIKLASHYGRESIPMNGSDSTWHTAMNVIEDSKIGIGFRHDDNSLYVCVTPMLRPVAREILMAGLTVWFDSSGGKNKIFGIHFPLGLAGFGLSPRLLGAQKDSGRSFEENMQNRLKELEILRPDQFDQIRVPIKELQGIAVKVELSQEGMFYVLKVPLRMTKDFPYAISFDAPKNFSVGLETADMKAQRAERSGGEMGGGGEGGGRRGGGSMRGGGRGGGVRGGGDRGEGAQRPDPIKLWVRVQLPSADKAINK